MTGAQTLIRTLVNSEVDVCFANPGTSEMHFVAALDSVPEMRAVLALFEGVVTGAADGYGRMTGRPAATLLHLGPGLGNGIANLHNARRARTPIVNIVGEHATYHQRFDAPLQSDIVALAGNVSKWVRVCATSDDLTADATDAVAAAVGPPGGIATLVVPADVSWGTLAGTSARQRPVPPTGSVPADTIESVRKVLVSEEPVVILLGGRALRERGLRAAASIAEATAATLLAETFPARLERGGGLPTIERLAYLGEMAIGQLASARHIILVDTAAPVSFFAYPGQPSELWPTGCELHVLAGPEHDVERSLEALADAVWVSGSSQTDGLSMAPLAPLGRPRGPLTSVSLAAAIACMLPEGAVVVDESNTAGVFLSGATEGTPRHDWLCNTGGAIGQGLPVATGAAIGAPDRPVLCIQADGSAMYTIQSLWTQAREGLDVTTVILSNRAYAILNLELSRVGVGAGGPRAERMLELSSPDLDFVSLAQGMGVPATRATTAEDLVVQLQHAVREPGPHLVEAVLPVGLG
ncbi:MAG: acetolactate synthase large subunit [Acidimicrobiales bacterium]|jgi:acetolactate synthase I/II/III large subunit